jgi:murein DD-endopeptidase MepM/ murein hydrolase activator NlpD
MPRTKKQSVAQTSSKFLLAGISVVAISTATATQVQAQNLPYPAGTTYKVTQTWGGTFSHYDYYNKYAVDFGMPVNQPVAAVAPGRVHKAWGGGANLARGCDRRFINNASYVVIDHGNGKSSLYLHLNAVNVSVGQTVSQGQVIGLSGNTGYSCGAHLHFTFQKTTNNVFGESISGGFVETGNGMPVLNSSYTSQNRQQIIPAASMIISVASGRALDNGGTNGTSIYLHSRPDNNQYQRWRLDSLGNGEYRVSAVPTGRVLDGGGENGGMAYLHPQWMPGNNYQKWRLQAANGGFMLINVATGRALDSGGANGTQIYMHPRPDGNPYQVWRLPG